MKLEDVFELRDGKLHIKCDVVFEKQIYAPNVEDDFGHPAIPAQIDPEGKITKRALEL